MAELADALDSGSSGGCSVQVQVLSPAPVLAAVDKNQLPLFLSPAVSLIAVIIVVFG